MPNNATISADTLMQSVWMAIVRAIQAEQSATNEPYFTDGISCRVTPIRFGGNGPAIELECDGLRFYCWPWVDADGDPVIVTTSAAPTGSGLEPGIVKVVAKIIESERGLNVCVIAGENVAVDLPGDTRCLPPIYAAATSATASA